MAIPFNLPTDEQTEDNYRRLDQLLQDLYDMLRQILFPASTAARTHNVAPAPSRSRPVADVTATGSRRDLPDVVSSAAAGGCACCHCPARRRHRRRRRGSCHAQAQQRPLECPRPPVHPAVPVPVPAPAPSARVENWFVIGEQLRKIAEEFRTTFAKPEVMQEREDSLKVEVKSSGLFSLLVPAHLRSPLWTTVILLVGWRLLVRTR